MRYVLYGKFMETGSRRSSPDLADSPVVVKPSRLRPLEENVAVCPNHQVSRVIVVEEQNSVFETQ
jgi:hypothetical protein